MPPYRLYASRVAVCYHSSITLAVCQVSGDPLVPRSEMEGYWRLDEVSRDTAF